MPETDKDTHQLLVEVNAKLWKAINDRVAIEQRKHPNRKVTRSEIVRDILTKELRP